MYRFSNCLLVQSFSFRANKEEADRSVRDINKKMLELSGRIDSMKPDFEEFSKLMDKLIALGVNEPTTDHFTAEELNFWDRCDGKITFSGSFSVSISESDLMGRYQHVQNEQANLKSVYRDACTHQGTCERQYSKLTKTVSVLVVFFLL